METFISLFDLYLNEFNLKIISRKERELRITQTA